MQRCNAVLNKHFPADRFAFHSLSLSFQYKMGRNSSKSKGPKNTFYRVHCLCAHTTPPNVEHELFSRIQQYAKRTSRTRAVATLRWLRSPFCEDKIMLQEWSEIV